MKLNHLTPHFEIDSSDLLQSERIFYFDYEESSDEHVLEFIEELEDLIYLDNKYELLTNFSKEYDKKVTFEYSSKIGNPAKLLNNPTFVRRERMYDMLRPIKIYKGNRNFGYWFSLKLRQYGKDLEYLSSFLDYHFSKTFNKDFKDFSKLLKVCLAQRISFLNDPVLKEFTLDWIEDKRVEINAAQSIGKKKTNETKNEQEHKISFTLKKYHHDKNYFLNNSIVVSDVLKELKKGKFLCKTNELGNPINNREQFKKLFTNQSLKEDPMYWEGTNTDLMFFVKILVSELKLVLGVGKRHWDIILDCFVKADGGEFEKDQVKGAKGKWTERTDKLKEILEML